MPIAALRLAGLPIRQKLQLITLILLPAVFVLTATTVLTIQLLSGFRAYVAGEGLFSKYQKDAVYHLDRFVRDGRDQDLARYREAIAVPLADVEARSELEREDPDYEQVRRHLLGGKNADRDIPWMIRIFRWLQNVPHVRDALQMWAEAIPGIRQLVEIGDHLASRRADGPPLSPAERTAILERIERLNSELIVLENRFTEAMGQGFHAASRLLFVALFVVDALILGAGLWMGNRIARGITRQVGELTRGAEALAGGDRSTRVAADGGDELGRLAGCFNEMASSIENAEAGLRNALSVLSSTLESTADGILVLDLEGRLVAFNEKVAEIWRIDPTRLSPGMPIGDLLFVAEQLRDPAAGLEQFAKILSDHGATTRDLLEFSDGRFVERVSQPQREDGRVVGRVFSFRDVTDKNRFEKELIRSNRDLEQFAYVASHDLQEPLRTVASYVQMLDRRYRGRLDRDADEFIQFAVDGSVRMQSLIRDLLEFSRVGAGRTPLEPVDPRAAVDAACRQLRTTIESTGATVRCESLPAVRADPAQLEQIFQNLIANAIKFRGETPPLIEITARQSGAECEVAVADNGIGIPSEFRERIFVIFQRLHPIGRYEGTGIGLALCKKIVERHGGRIWVEPHDGRGSIFRFTLPAAGERSPRRSKPLQAQEERHLE